jgi:hypothetical protein
VALRGIHIELWERRDVVEMLDVLLDAGWGLPQGWIKYLPLDDDDDWDWQEARWSEWQVVRWIMRARAYQDRGAGILLEWPGLGVPVHFVLKETQVDLHLFALGPFLPGACEGQFTDFSWYLSRTLEPLLAAGCSVRRVECSDDQD